MKIWLIRQIHDQESNYQKGCNLNCFPISYYFITKCVGTNLKVMSESIHYRCISLDYLAIAAERIDKFNIWQGYLSEIIEWDTNL